MTLRLGDVRLCETCRPLRRPARADCDLPTVPACAPRHRRAPLRRTDPRRRRVAGAGLVALGLLLATPSPGAGQPAATPTTTRPPTAGFAPDGRDAPWLEDPRVDPSLAGVSVDSLGFKLALTRYRTTQDNLALATRTREGATTRLTELAAAESRLVGIRNQATRRRDKSRARLEVVQAELRDLAVDDYVRGAQPEPLTVALDPDAATDRGRLRVLVTSVRAERLAEQREHTAVVADTSALLASTETELAEVQGRIATDAAVRERALADEARFTAQLATDARALADERLTGPVTGLDLSFVALDAYVKAANRMAAERPACGIRWTLLAGVGRTESRHGTYNGSRLRPDGGVEKPIIGIALDGSGGTALIIDTDGGAFDGDPAFDRAVGPMQFIPGTWRTMQRDGNGDGQADPHNMYDAALAAAAYLCRSSSGLDSDEGALRALRSYNNDGEYGRLVLERAHGYDEFVLPTPPRRPQ